MKWKVFFCWIFFYFLLYFTLHLVYARYLIMFMFYGSRDALTLREGPTRWLYQNCLFVCLFINKFEREVTNFFFIFLLMTISWQQTIFIAAIRATTNKLWDAISSLYKHETNEFVEQLLIKVNLKFMIWFF